jgi:excisionase family DNA binding protein
MTGRTGGGVGGRSGNGNASGNALTCGVTAVTDVTATGKAPPGAAPAAAGALTSFDLAVDKQGDVMAEMAHVPTVVPKRHLYRIPEAMVLLSMSRSVIYEQIRAGRLKTVKQGASRLVPAAAINAYVQLLLGESGVEFDQAS